MWMLPHRWATPDKDRGCGPWSKAVIWLADMHGSVTDHSSTVADWLEVNTRLLLSPAAAGTHLQLWPEQAQVQDVAPLSLTCCQHDLGIWETFLWYVALQTCTGLTVQHELWVICTLPTACSSCVPSRPQFALGMLEMAPASPSASSLSAASSANEYTGTCVPFASTVQKADALLPV